jgi:hypothetical protein
MPLRARGSCGVVIHVLITHEGRECGKNAKKKTPNTGLLHHEDRGRENRRGRRDCADGTSLRGENLRLAEQGQNYRRLCFSSFLSAKVVFFLSFFFPEVTDLEGRMKQGGEEIRVEKQVIGAVCTRGWSIIREQIN